MSKLSAFPSFEDQSLKQLIDQHGKQRNFEAGSIVMDVGDPVHFMPLLIEGVLKIVREDEHGNELLMYYLHPGDTCAVSLTCCENNSKSEVRAIAEEKCEIIFIPVEFIDQWGVDFPAWKHFIMLTYRKRFEELLNTIDEIAFKKMDERLKSYLKKKALATEKNNISATHLEIATDLNSSREVISRLLKQLEKKGEIKLGRNKIDVSDLH